MSRFFGAMPRIWYENESDGERENKSGGKSVRDVSWAAFQQKNRWPAGRHAPRQWLGRAVIFRIGNNQFFALANWKVARRRRLENRLSLFRASRQFHGNCGSGAERARQRWIDATREKNWITTQALDSLNNTHSPRTMANAVSARDGAWKFAVDRYRTGKSNYTIWKNRI